MRRVFLLPLLNYRLLTETTYSFLAAASKQHYSDLERLQKDLFTNYSTNIIPQKEKTIAVKVKFDIALNQIIDLVSSTVLLNHVNFTHLCLLSFYVILKGVHLEVFLV